MHPVALTPLTADLGLTPPATDHAKILKILNRVIDSQLIALTQVYPGRVR